MINYRRITILKNFKIKQKSKKSQLTQINRYKNPKIKLLKILKNCRHKINNYRNQFKTRIIQECKANLIKNNKVYYIILFILKRTIINMRNYF